MLLLMNNIDWLRLGRRYKTCNWSAPPHSVLISLRKTLKLILHGAEVENRVYSVFLDHEHRIYAFSNAIITRTSHAVY